MTHAGFELDRRVHTMFKDKAMWIESSFDAEGHRFRVSIRRLGENERERIAAELAWFGHCLSTPDVDVEAIGWVPFLQRILSDDVAITVADDALDRIENMWDHIVWRTLRAFIDANHLDPALKRHLRSEPTPGS
jgi:hypothetical protein